MTIKMSLIFKFKKSTDNKSGLKNILASFLTFTFKLCFLKRLEAVVNILQKRNVENKKGRGTHF